MNSHKPLVETMDSPWFRTLGVSHASAMRLFCFPYAGAGASAFVAWSAAVGPEIQVVAVVYPGRETRTHEKPLVRLADFIAPLASAIRTWSDRPFAFFGHSMGGRICFELARTLEASAGPVPEHVFVSAVGAPHLREPRPLHALSNAALLRALVQLNGIPNEVKRRPEMLAQALPVLRADFEVCEASELELGSPLMAPLTAYLAEDDCRVEPERISAWRDLAGVAFRQRKFPGDHFYLRAQRNALIADIRGQLLAGC